MALNNYETVFIVTPVLSEAQMKDTVQKFKDLLVNNKAEIVHEENWGLKSLAYEIKGKSTGFYTLIEFKSEPTLIATLETEFKRDERIMRFLTVSLDKHAVAYNERRRKGFPKIEKTKKAVEA
ncbi:MAG TPA: 30S ribosomal protein S6 [Cytophagales bacterium]|nr:30S ribosomal protein S6 [Cytophagales bacterium]